MRGLAWGTLLFLLAVRAEASDGNELYAIGAIQKSIGGAGVAQPYDATWTLLNPATLPRLEARVDASFELLFMHAESHPRGSALVSNPFAGEMELDAELPIPSMGVVLPLKSGTLGFGAFGMQGNSTDFPHPRTTLSLLQNGDRRSSYQVVRLPIAYGMETEHGWAWGAALVPVGSRFNTDSITLRLRPTDGDAGWRYAFGAGFQVGVAKHWEKLSLGANYTSRVWMQDYATYERDLVTSNLDLPQKLQVGLAWRPAKRWTFLADWKWTEWSATPLFGNKTIEGGLGWNNQNVYKLGLVWDATERLTLRAGASYGRSAIEDEFIFANAISPALGELHLAAGATWRISKRHEIHASLTHVRPESNIESGSGDIFSFLARGTRTAYAEDSVTVQYTLKF